ncbi:hypothetical protein KR51_00026580 [Rubidibacter lacunae KORDI 51-2]|uniref:Uncharacterized protein n=1 Tax=Rubidibacter lacunae KORDI 51-2 TaxID=582515 RepID=U5DJC5_9CHRO|nr:hypothetical protein [Rubidibacter lacunae]ERN40674.1 hypothetical protein KR51_00026580 [Rubidibacter lacunae KORDI 51-2]
MAPNPAVVKAIAQLNYRATVGDLASEAGLELNEARQGLLAVAADAGGHLQVAESGDIAYEFPQNFRTLLRNKYWRLRLQDSWQRVWGILFYLVRISFGILLIATIVLMVVAIAVIAIAASSQRSRDGNRSSSNESSGVGIPIFFMPRFIWFGPDPFWFFYYDYGAARRRRDLSAAQAESSPSADYTSDLNFLEAIFSFLFGDGNPNPDREERRWQAIGSAIRQQGGAIAAEHVAPYVDEVDEDEDFLLPVLVRFDGRPEVSERGDLVYYFPELQVTAATRSQSGPSNSGGYFEEHRWRFSQASMAQLSWAGGLGGLYLVLAFVLGDLIQSNPELAAGIRFIAFVDSLLPLILIYGIAYLAVPAVRYLWIQWRNQKIRLGNLKRADRALQLAEPSPELQAKLDFARQFAARTVVDRNNLAYTSERDLLEQENEHSDAIDAEWQRRLDADS